MKTVNKLILLGIVGRDPEVRFSTNGMPIATFSLATSKKSKDKPDVTQWHNLVAFQKTAELVRDYVKKGSKLYIEGEVQYSEYEKDGVKRTATKVIVNEMSFLSSPNELTSNAHAPNNSQAKPSDTMPSTSTFEDDDMPF